MSGPWARPPEGVPSRNETEGFAIRTKKNLDFVVAAHDSGQDVHVVTQLVLSLLGMVVFPFERDHSFVWQEPLADLEDAGWPAWVHRSGGYVPTTLGQLIRVLRHATAHGNIAFSSDSRYLADVTISFANVPPHGGLRWDGSIPADQLLLFCRRYLDYMWNAVA
jgi:hypothetical protein